MSETEILSLIGLKESDINRYRGCDIDDDMIVVYARTGGNNREYYLNDDLTNNPYYLYDEDDSYDNTYANYYFEIPNGTNDKIEEENIPFPWQHIKAYCRGEITFDVACDNTIEELYKLIDEYVKEHKE